MTVVADLGDGSASVPSDEDAVEVQDERGSLPLLGMASLGSSAVFVAWTSLTCFVC